MPHFECHTNRIRETKLRLNDNNFTICTSVFELNSN
uniref:Uncharacterized protein n=1 Tax=Arundo donax TaxID=35708 RepID=A0A0A9CHQ8_ARUDO